MGTKIEKKIEKELASSSNSKTLESSPMTSYKPKVPFPQALLQPPHFRTPRAIISDRGNQFCNCSFEALLRKYSITHTEGLANRIAYKTPIGMSLFRLLFGKSCHLPIELEHRAYWAIKAITFDLKRAGSNRKLVMNLCSISVITFARLTLEHMGHY
ncbi:hypothetical protein M9H77_23045 [Catharanthus roseus]|uniref:Uncharacterized protein n=1 Tax=Catharanthus roseus TaxID=4058 RepID=A0ACC0AUR0_CATRO|nr:hypothetical protein M9H77_23045 [Catharanthus roseus]